MNEGEDEGGGIIGRVGQLNGTKQLQRTQKDTTIEDPKLGGRGGGRRTGRGE